LPRLTRLGLSEGIPAMAGNNGADDLSPLFQSDRAAMSFQLSAGHGVNAIAFAKGRPIQAVGLVQDDFAFIGRTVGPLG